MQRHSQYKIKDSSVQRTSLVVTYHNDNSPLAAITKKHFAILQSNNKLKSVFLDHHSYHIAVPKTRGILLSEQNCPKKIKKITMKFLFHIHVIPPDAKNCSHMVSTQVFSSYTTKQSLVIRQHITCTTTSVIYYLVGCSLVFSTSAKLAKILLKGGM